MKIFAGIVLYNPDIVRLRENIESVINQVDQIIIVDNFSNNYFEIEQLLKMYNGVFLIRNYSNEGIAMALSQIMNHSINANANWVLTLDQDSVCESDLVSRYLKFSVDKKIGLMTCRIQDRNFNIDEYFSHSDEFKCVNTCITSGSFMNVDAYKNSNGYDIKMFIDKVDFDICFSLREIGYKIIKINYLGLLHEVGQGKIVNLLGKNYTVFNHPYTRRYYRARNGIYIARKHLKKIGIKKYFSCILKEFRELAIVFIFEDNKLKKLFFGIKGLLNGFSIKIE